MTSQCYYSIVSKKKAELSKLIHVKINEAIRLFQESRQHFSESHQQKSENSLKLININA